ncbi:MAG: Ig-like domain-containing protein, partial [Muribaculaceae bacterium]|nr:Ig-like domain-containing protein [Muribaculaceae bacterium]
MTKLTPNRLSGWRLLLLAMAAIMPANHLLADSKGEYFWNSDPGPGRATAVTLGSATDGYSSMTVDASALQPGAAVLGIRSFAGGRWSQTYTSIVMVAPEATGHNWKAEYFWDDDPGHGAATALPLDAPGAATAALDIAALCHGIAAGDHLFGVRVNAGHGWSNTVTSIVRVSEDGSHEIIAAEYFWGDDPGIGQGTPVEITPAGEIALDNLAIDFPSEVAAEYHLSFRARTAAAWGHTCTAVIPHLYVTAIEIDAPESSVTEGSEMQLSASVIPADAFNDRLEWHSSDESVATVDGTGLVTALMPGVTTITAASTDGTGITAACEVEVSRKSGLAGAPDGGADIRVIATEGAITVRGVADGTPIRVISVTGHTVRVATERRITGLAPGIYFVIVNGQACKVAI